MSTTTHRPTRRDDRRAQTILEIKSHAMDQIAGGGPDAVALSGIVRAMSMSPAAIYRYFANRDALLADLVVDAYDDFADHLAAAAAAADVPSDRLAAVTGATHDWALANPNSYRLVFQTALGSGAHLAPERTIPAASRSMAVLVDAITDLGGAPRTGPDAAPELDAAVHAWAERSGLTHVRPDALRLALTTWTRLHGVISLEIGGHLGATGVGADLLYAAEVAEITART